MNWDAIGAIGEIAGAAGVILTLVYLTSQLRQNTRALRTSAYQMYNERTDSFWDFQAEHAGVLGPLLEQGVPYDALDGAQKIVLDASMMKGFNVLEGMFLNHRSGIVSDSEFREKVEGFRVSFRNPISYAAWRRLAPTMSFTAEFRHFMETEIYATQAFDERSWFVGFEKET